MAAHNLNFNLETVEMMRFQLGTFWSEGRVQPPHYVPQSFVELMSKCPYSFYTFPFHALLPPDSPDRRRLHFSASRVAALGLMKHSHIAMMQPNTSVLDISGMILLSFWQVITFWTSSLHVQGGLWDIHFHFKLQMKADRCMLRAGGKHLIFSYNKQ